MTIQWYPGHMAKAKREISERLKIIDIVLEIRDSRIPRASGNPDLAALIGGKTRIVVLNKADLADPVATEGWRAALSRDEALTVEADSRSVAGLRQVRAEASAAAARLSERLAARGRRPRPARMLVVGVPNVGKSTIINRLAQRGAARTADRPGVTRGQQWVTVGKSLELLDTPGLLWPRFDDPEVGVKLAVTAAIDDRLTDVEELCNWLIDFLMRRYPLELSSYCGLDSLPSIPGELIDRIGRLRGCLQSGDRVDSRRAAEVILRDFRDGKIGRISLEHPGDLQ